METHRCTASPICELDDGHAWDSVAATGMPVRWHARTFGRVEISQEETVTAGDSHVLTAPAVFVGELLECLPPDDAAALGADLTAAAEWLRGMERAS